MSVTGTDSRAKPGDKLFAQSFARNQLLDRTR
jgi:hypothetical protein